MFLESVFKCERFLHQKEFDYEDILEYVKEEIEFKKTDENSIAKMGFLK